jgi:hypothetical protein
MPVQVMGPATMIGEIAMVTITDVGTNSLFGTLVDQPVGAKPMLMDAEG